MSVLPIKNTDLLPLNRPYLVSDNGITARSVNAKIVQMALGFYNRALSGSVRSAYLLEIAIDSSPHEFCELAPDDRGIAFSFRQTVRDLYS